MRTPTNGRSGMDFIVEKIDGKTVYIRFSYEELKRQVDMSDILNKRFCKFLEPSIEKGVTLVDKIQGGRVIILEAER